MTQTTTVKRKRRWGDRKDGRRIRTLPPMSYIEPFIMVTRNDALVQFADEFSADAAEKYIQEKRKEGMQNFSMLHFMVAAYVRTVSQRPALNRFIAGQQIYTHGFVEVNLDIKKEMKIDAPDSVLSVRIDPAATAQDVYKILDDAISSTRSEVTNMDKAAAVFNKIPRFIRKFLFWLIRLLDYYGWLPDFLYRLSPFHGSFFITSMSSIGLPPIFHHIYNLGTVPCFMAIGRTKKRLATNAAGETVEKRYLPYAVVLDERICDGYYFASAFRVMTGVFRNPHMLDNPPEQVFEDID